MRGFASHIHTALENFVAERGFAWDRTTLKRQRGKAIEDRILFDNGGRDSSSYRILVGFAAPVVLGAMDGVLAERHFTGGSLASSPRKLGCRDAAQLEASLNRFLACYDSVIEPYFEVVPDCGALAEILPPIHDWYRALLFLEAGDGSSAREELCKYRARLEKMEQNSDVVAAILGVKQALSRCT